MKLSVITPSLNQGRYLQECLESVRTAAEAAPLHTIEHIVIDGGSHDDSKKVLAAQTFAAWVSEPDAGQSHAINKGLTRATGDILAYLCADDLYEPQALVRVLEIFENNSDVDLIYGDFFFLEGDSGKKRRKSAATFSPSNLQNHNPLGQPAVWWRRRVYERFGGFDESLRFCMDHEYWLRLGERVRWHYIPEPLAVSRLHGDAKTSRQLSAMWRESAQMLTRNGWRLRPWWNVFTMAVWGRHYYRMKRWWFSR